MSTASAPIKIWYQSFVDPSEQSGYFGYLKEALASLADPAVVFEAHGISPPDLELHRITEFRCAAQVLRNAVIAQQQGYDAFVIGHFQDSGLYETRAAVDLPVLSLGEASMLYACILGQKIGLVTINPIFIPMHEEQVRRYGLQERVTAINAITTNPDELNRAFTQPAAFDKVLQQFREQVQPLVERGVEVIIPAGGLPALLFSRLKNFTIGNAAVLDPIAVLVKTAEMAVKLRRLNGTQASRRATFVKPSEQALREFLES
jgi:allantoin racemase